MTEMTPGAALRARFDAALAAESQRTGKTLEFDEHEIVALEQAALAADRGAHLRELYARTAADPEASPSLLAKISAEARQCEKAVVDLLGRVKIGEGPAKSERHQRAVNARWARRDAQWARKAN